MTAHHVGTGEKCCTYTSYIYTHRCTYAYHIYTHCCTHDNTPHETGQEIWVSDGVWVAKVGGV